MARMIWSTLLLVAASVSAQSIVSSNSTEFGSNSGNGAVALEITQGNNRVAGPFDLVPLTSAAAGLQANDVMTNPILLANDSTELTLRNSDIAAINCDQYSGNLQAIDIFNTAVERNVTAIVLYSRDQPYCRMDGVQTSFDQIYTMKSSQDAANMVNAVNSLPPNAAGGEIALNSTLATNAQQNAAANNNNNNSNNNNSMSPPSTAVAMIILYSITGVITALFLTIIITGAVRAHRHPERYGPRNIMGRPRQSRARGLARAMLETLPVVRFGDREEDQQRAKPTDVELGEGEIVTGEIDTTKVADATTTREAAHEEGDNPSGIAAATPARPSTSSHESANEGCSICTDDFVIGQLQRVLPCNHRFHPECVDPWLLNISGTCPLCRIDLRPTGAEDEDDGDADRNRPSQEGGETSLAPPLDGGSRRASVRRSILVGLTGYAGPHRPERMTREERVEALREYSRRNRVRRRGAATVEEGSGAGVDEEVERGMRKRLRNAFRVRTRRTGEDEEELSPPAGGGSAAAVESAAAADTTASSSAAVGETSTARPA